MKTHRTSGLPLFAALTVALGGCGEVYVTQAPANQPPPPAPAPSAPAPAAYSDFDETDPSAFEDFNPVLAPHGAWQTDPSYGTVWVPDAGQVGADFVPYETNGSWSYTEEGEYLWVSRYSWGYVPFHYGRWVRSQRGWAWVPGRRYAPAWVVWSTSDAGYVGWAPIPPSWYWTSAGAYALSVEPTPVWTYCASANLFHPEVRSYVVRDRLEYERVALRSTLHRPAAHEPPTSPWERTYRRATPSLAQLGIPQNAVPRERARPDPNAYALATKAGAQRWRVEVAPRIPPPAQRPGVANPVLPPPPVRATPPGPIHAPPPPPRRDDPPPPVRATPQGPILTPPPPPKRVDPPPPPPPPPPKRVHPPPPPSQPAKRPPSPSATPRPPPNRR